MQNMLFPSLQPSFSLADMSSVFMIQVQQYLLFEALPGGSLPRRW